MEGKTIKKSRIAVENRVTSIDVARAAGVSQSSVSRALTPGSILSDETRKKILATIDELGYKPNAIARSLISHKTNIIGIVMVNSAPFYANILTEFTKRLQNTGRQVLLFNSEQDQDIDNILSTVLQYRVDGLIIASAWLSSRMADECVRNGTPVILFNRYVPNANSSAVCCDNVEGGRMVANFFLDAEHKHIAYISGKENVSTNNDRKKGFIDRLNERGYTDCIIEAGKYSYTSGAEAARRLLAREDRPDAIFCADDTMALGTMDVARYEFGLRIPEDLSVVGFDDIPMASWPTYSLTTVRQPVERMLDATMELLELRLSNINEKPILQLFDGKLIKRNSARLPVNYAI